MQAVYGIRQRLGGIAAVKENLTGRGLVESMDRILSSFHRRGLFNGSSLMADGGKVIYKRSFGFADRAWLLPNKPETAFMLGSNTKQFTAMLVMQLVEKGLVELCRTVDHYLPYFRKDIGGKITIHNLLTHTSGLPNYTAAPSFWIDDRFASFTNEKMITEFTRGELEFKPGTRFSYCNTGYYILGDVIERVTGKPYAEVLKENIVVPLGLENTGFFRGAGSPLGFAAGYVVDENGIKAAEFINPQYSYSAGNIYSSVEDLYRWDRALDSERLLSKKNLDLMFTPYLNNYAFGWVSTEVSWAELAELFKDPLHYQYRSVRGDGRMAASARLIMHRGSQYGYDSLIVRMVDRRQLVVLLSNTAGSGAPFLEEIAFRLINVMNDLGLGD